MREGRSSLKDGGPIGALVFSALIAIGTAGAAFAQELPEDRECQKVLQLPDAANPGALEQANPSVIGEARSNGVIRADVEGVEVLDRARLFRVCPAVAQTLAGVAQAVNNTAQIASNLTQDIIAAALDGDIQPETSTLGAFSAGSPGQTTSNFMVSGYKFLAHDGFMSSSAGSSFKTAEFEEQNYGLTVGTRFDGSSLFDVAPGSVTLGVVGNYTHTEIEVGASKIGEAEVDSWSVGTFGLVTDGQRYGLFTITGTFGSPETSSEAVVPVNAEFNNFALATSAVAGTILPLGDSKLDLRGGVNYVRASGDDYTDSIGLEYTDGRMEEFSGSVSARLLRIVKLDDAIVRPFVQSGLTHRFHYENELTIDGEKFSYDDADTSVFARAGVDFDIGTSTQAYLAVRGDASEDFEAIAAQVGVTFKLD